MAFHHIAYRLGKWNVRQMASHLPLVNAIHISSAIGKWYT